MKRKKIKLTLSFEVEDFIKLKSLAYSVNNTIEQYIMTSIMNDEDTLFSHQENDAYKEQLKRFKQCRHALYDEYLPTQKQLDIEKALGIKRSKGNN